MCGIAPFLREWHRREASRHVGCHVGHYVKRIGPVRAPMKIIVDIKRIEGRVKGSKTRTEAKAVLCLAQSGPFRAMALS